MDAAAVAAAATDANAGELPPPMTLSLPLPPLLCLDVEEREGILVFIAKLLVVGRS